MNSVKANVFRTATLLYSRYQMESLKYSDGINSVLTNGKPDLLSNKTRLRR